MTTGTRVMRKAHCASNFIPSCWIRGRIVEEWGQVSDADLAEFVQALPRLRELGLDQTEVTDLGLAKLKRLPHLTRLSLNGTKVTDAGLDHLDGLKQLRELLLTDTKVTDEGVAKLQQALPNCTIHH